MSLAVFFSQHLLVIALFLVKRAKPPTAWWFWLDPFRGLARPHGQPHEIGAAAVLLGLTAVLAADGALLMLAWRRARHVGNFAWIATLAIVPVLQLGAIAWLSAAPDGSPEAETSQGRATRLDVQVVVQSLLLGVGLILGTVVLSAVIFGVYGTVLFLIAPFLIAIATGYLANRREKIGFRRTLGLVAITFAIGGATLVGFALEGVACVLMAAPLGAIVGAVGGALGAGLAALGRPGRGTVVYSIAVLPILLVAEAIVPPHAAFDSVEYVDIAAPPNAVWDAVVHMGPIPDAPAAPFRWGLAYPVRGEILGTGVGSLRRGVFSTGVAYERVTEWVPGQKLSFVVLSDPPTMRELSPYAHVNAPHVNGYFRTLDARFTLAPIANGRTRLALATRHELDLAPAAYWVPFVEWAVHANKVRVLAHFRQQAETQAAGRLSAVP